ncbi:MAG: U32 family peptidase [Planctomycetaceae bacterium]|nr:U32 family peptidase [Planctomycetaceae bacterium]
MTTKFSPSIELLSPAGDWECALAAIENGADAVYFGLDCGFNARHRAKNFGLQDLPALCQMLRRRGVRGYATLNTLVFPSEMDSMVDVVHQIAASGLDAVLVQDFGVARLVHELCPELEIHASTQMSLTSAETISVARELGLSRVVLARELSVKEVSKIASATDMPLEVFIHGALCVAYSGQCLTSESLGGRSANRGQCAQACRLPYELICDGEDRELGEVQYLLSPQDLAGYASIPDLIQAGVASLKIEGRLKTPEYVANITRHYRDAIDEALKTGVVTVGEEAKREMELSFSRGFSPGWLEGNDHKRLVKGLDSAKHGILLGAVTEINQARQQIRVVLAAPAALGDGLAVQSFEATQGGRIYGILDERGCDCREATTGTTVWITFGREDIDWSVVKIDDSIYKNDDPQLNRRLRQSFDVSDPVQRQALNLSVVARVGEPLRLTGKVANGGSVSIETSEILSLARKRPATMELLREKLGRLGGTPFELNELEADLQGAPMIPMAMLNQCRRDLVEALLSQCDRGPKRDLHLEKARSLLKPIIEQESQSDVLLTVLCRSLAQVEAVCATDVDVVYADFHDIRQYAEVVEIARRHDKRIGLASVRIQKPGEMGLLKVIARHQPDLMLARNLAAMQFCRSEAVPFVADFSLNVANHRSAEWIKELGATRVTASYDLNRPQLLELLDSLPPAWMELVIHQYMPMFHMEHCVYCAVMSPGTNKTNCGRPCDHHVVQLRDRVGAEHPLVADVACRNTLFNATAQSGAEMVSDLVQLRVAACRIELLNENPSQVQSTISIYRDLLAGRVSGRDVWRRLQADNRIGVTRGTLETKRNPLAIL